MLQNFITPKMKRSPPEITTANCQVYQIFFSCCGLCKFPHSVRYIGLSDISQYLFSIYYMQCSVLCVYIINLIHTYLKGGYFQRQENNKRQIVLILLQVSCKTFLIYSRSALRFDQVISGVKISLQPQLKLQFTIIEGTHEVSQKDTGVHLKFHVCSKLIFKTQCTLYKNLYSLNLFNLYCIFYFSGKILVNFDITVEEQ